MLLTFLWGLAIYSLEHFFLLHFLCFVVFAVCEMSSSQVVSNAVLGKDKLEPRLLSLCMNAGVSETILNHMGDN